MPKYARFNVLESWVVDVSGQKVWVYRQPNPDGYLQIQAHERGAVLKILSLEIIVDEILGEPDAPARAPESE